MVPLTPRQHSAGYLLAGSWGRRAVNFADLIAVLQSMRAELAKQLAAFGPPMYLRTFNWQRETTEESKQHIRGCIEQVDQLLRHYGAE